MALTPRKPCKGKPNSGPTNPPPVITPTATELAVSAAAASGTVGTTVLITAQLRTASGPLAQAGVPVAWSTTAGSLSSTTSSTDATGKATVTLTLSSVAGTSHKVTGTTTSLTGFATVSSIAGAASRFAVTVSDLTPNQNTTVQSQAQLKDSFGNNVSQAGVLTTWTKTGAGGSFASGTSLTDASGIARQDFTVADDPAVNHTITATAGSITGTSATIDVQATPVIPPPEESPVLDWAGPTANPGDLPPELNFWDTNLEAKGDAFYTDPYQGGPAIGPRWDGGNATAWYDTALAYYVEWTRTGESKWLDRANAMVLNYYNNYLLPADYATSPHYSGLDSMYMYFLLNGDTAIRDSCVIVASKFLAFYPNIDNLGIDWLENRVQTRVMMAWWIAEKILGVGADVGNGTQTYTAVLDDAINRVLAMQSSDGSWRFPLGTCGESLNYMSAMLADFFIRIYRNRPGLYNPAIKAALIKLGTYLWTQWRGAMAGAENQSFNYVSGLCLGTGSPTPTPDLNGFFTPLFAWLGLETGDTAWWDKLDLIFAGMQNADLDLWKQFTESYTNSYRALGYRYGA